MKRLIAPALILVHEFMETGATLGATRSRPEPAAALDACLRNSNALDAVNP